MKVLDCGDQVADWLSRVLAVPNVRLIQYVNGEDLRPARTEGKHPAKFEKEFPVVFQNYASLHLTTTSSMESLNERITANSGAEHQVNYKHFRPNVIVENSLAWDEDKWLYMKLGEQAEMLQVMNCSRCLQTTVNREDAVAEKEPLKTLKL